METTYLFHLRFVLVLTMVWFRPHHLRHQCQISIFASSNHIHHHIYFKNPYVHIQVFHILHHHTMKLLQALKSFLTGDSIIENRQRKLVCCWLHNLAAKLLHYRPHSSTAKTDSPQAAHSAAKTDSPQALIFQQRMLLRCSQHTFSSEC